MAGKADDTATDSAAGANSSAAPAQRPLQVRFEDGSVSYASQFLVNSTAEELIVGFSSGVMDNGDGGAAVLPVQNRIAMSRPAAARLVRLLADALRRSESGKGAAPPAQKSAGN